MNLIDVQDLTVSYRTDTGAFKAVNHVSLHVSPGRSLGIIGESGCGKTTLGMAILRLLPENAEITDGKILFRETDLLSLNEAEMQSLRGGKISMIFQAAMNSLNPVIKVGKQIVEAIQAHDPEISTFKAREKAAHLFGEVGIEEKRLDDYPHQFSGGMKQRAIIAMALACGPELVIADEPTTALDMLVQSRILKKLAEIQEQRHLTIILISHDIGVVSEICHDIAVMYKGYLVESGTREALLESAAHPYTRSLLSSYMTLDVPADILFTPPEPNGICTPDSGSGNGCPFAPACPQAIGSCMEAEPEWQVINTTHCARCHLYR